MKENQPLRAFLVLIAAVATCLLAAPAAAHADEPGPAPIPSAGCASKTPLEQRATVEFQGSAKSGQYRRIVPAAADRPLPVVLALHGLLENIDIAELGSGMGEYGLRQGFVTVTPQLDRLAPSQWEFGPGSADITWLGEVLTHVESTVCADLGRIYVTGLSMGGFATSSAGCRFADRIAAIAPVAGLRDFSWCRPARPVPVIAFHGTDDPIVPYTGTAGTGSATGDENSGASPGAVTAAAQSWANRNGCTGGAQRTTIAADVVLDRYACPPGADVQLYSILGGGHIWPGSRSPLYPAFIVGANTTSIDATVLIWDFFRAHPGPAAR
ncbi:alpha/beta hydrolase family esterase [Nocardia sp. NPDC057227]|uniref:alpha/beta hydrolase family esterase n=1 Tax=Nocardia sp. NPDC057227 TaxID=3346056 RepID=UPI00362BE30A